MAKLRQLLLLIWKNFKLQSRHPFVTLLELGVPAFFSICLVLLRSDIPYEYVNRPVVYSSFSIDTLPANLTPAHGGTWQVLYAPNTPYLEGIMVDVASQLAVEYKGFPNENSMIEFFAKNSSTVLSGIVFSDDIKDGINGSKNISYTIRPKSAQGGTMIFQNTTSSWFTQLVFPMFPTLGPRNKDDAWGGDPGYMSEGFLGVQHAVAKSFMKKLSHTEDLGFDLLMNRYPYSPYLYDNFIVALQIFFPLILCFSFFYTAVNIVKNIVVEKEKKLKEAMKMMGLSKWLHWTAWYLKYIVFLSLSCCTITAVLFARFFDDNAVINKSDPTVFLFFLLVYSSTIICFCFFVSTLFSKANSSAGGSGVIFFLSFLPYFVILPRFHDLSMSEKAVFCLVPNLAIAMGSAVFTIAEASGEGIQWRNIATPPTPDDKLSLAVVILMLVVSGLISLLLTWYIENVFPGEYGVPEKWYFPFSYSYWRSQSTYWKSQNLDQTQFLRDPNYEFFEEEPTDIVIGIRLQGLTKTFTKGSPPAVKNVNLSMYRSHITVLLGHNGAGKSTTISMLTGLITPTSGTAYVHGKDIRTEISNVHSSLGICPQHDILFDELTVEEHLYFFCKLKGYKAEDVPDEIKSVLENLSLSGYRKTQSHALSGGWKRRLSVGIALVGKSQIVILDEPTSGMDPFNRRSLWNVLLKAKETRTILLTTHFMVEADALGDRIAIMAKGEVQCCGSPLFLKSKYGRGYQLVMVKGDSCDVPTVTNLVTSHVSTAEVSSNVGTELKYILPFEKSYLFHGLFSELEANKEALNISGYGASITTMEEIFISVTEEFEDQVNDSSHESVSRELNSPCQRNNNLEIHENPSINNDQRALLIESPQSNSGKKLFMQHLRALLEKRALHTLRNWKLTLSQLILPPIFLIITLVMVETFPKTSDAPPLALDIDSYRGTEIPFVVNMNSDEAKVLGGIFSLQFSDINKPVFLNMARTNLTDYLIDEVKKDMGDYNLHNMVAARFDVNSSSGRLAVTSLFNNQAFHSPAIALLEMDKTLLKHCTKDGSFTFAVTNNPLPRTISEKGKQQQTDIQVSYQIGQDLMFGMSFLVASFTVLIIKERASNSKHLQRVSGMNLTSYWLASFVWDYLNYLIPCCLVLVVFIFFKTEGLCSANELGRLFLLFMIHGFSALQFAYCCTFFFRCPSTAYVRLSLFNILIGFVCHTAIAILEIPDLGTASVAKPLDVTFSLLIPIYGLGRAVSNLYQNYQFNSFCNTKDVELVCEHEAPASLFELVKPCCIGKCEDVCIPWESNYFSWTSPGIGKQLVFFVIQFVFYTLLLVLCENNFLRSAAYRMRFRRATPEEAVAGDDAEDEDVYSERQRIRTAHLPNLLQDKRLVIREVSKMYGSFLAVDRLTLGVRGGECFGLLGVNGAGKTTTFKMITGDKSITSGDIYVNGFDVKMETRKVQSSIGYCPQFDALIDQLTGRETLTLFSRLRGVPEHLIPEKVNSLSVLLDFKNHIDKQVGNYSGGNKRKLSTAIALVGDPPVVFLDEPTTGMDPKARRRMWRVLEGVKESGRSVVLTSHSMDECEALCNRLVIMVNGRLCCLGSPQHLKTKFGQGFTLIVKVGGTPTPDFPNSDTASFDSHEKLTFVRNLKENMAATKTYVEENFHGAELKNKHENMLHYEVPKEALNWASMFQKMEEGKRILNIEDYSVGETTLEEVFLNFARLQTEE